MLPPPTVRRSGLLRRCRRLGALNFDTRRRQSLRPGRPIELTAGATVAHRPDALGLAARRAHVYVPRNDINAVNIRAQDRKADTEIALRAPEVQHLERSPMMCLQCVVNARDVGHPISAKS